MENVTHSLIGVVLGEGITRAYARRRGLTEQDTPRVRAGVLWASVLGSNLPDFDFLLRPIVGGGSLGSLLHHRGFTHTVACSPLLALIAAGVGRWMARRGAPALQPSWRLLLMTGWIAVLGHIAADFWNDYGVHPFWPLTNRWFYGDIIFIIEPLLWLSLLPFAFRAARHVWSKALSVALGLAILGLAWFGHYMSPYVAAWISAWTLGWIAVYRKDRGVAVPFAAILLVLALFAVPGQIARSRVKKLLPPDERLLQLAMTPAPSNPLCWRVVVTSRRERPTGSPPADYIARVGVKAFGPSDPATCSPRLMGPSDALWAQVEAPALKQPDFFWAGEFRGDLAQFRDAVDKHCRVRALLRFVRSPFWFEAPSGDMVAGDLRYHSGNGLGFADISSHLLESCYPFEPPWDFPSGVN